MGWQWVLWPHQPPLLSLPPCLHASELQWFEGNVPSLLLRRPLLPLAWPLSPEQLQRGWTMPVTSSPGVTHWREFSFLWDISFIFSLDLEKSFSISRSRLKPRDWNYKILVLVSKVEIGFSSDNAKPLFYFSFFPSVVVTGVVYPLATHWSWTSLGWLATEWGNYIHSKHILLITELCRGFTDFAGSAVVHLAGAVLSLPGCVILGARFHISILLVSRTTQSSIQD